MKDCFLFFQKRFVLQRLFPFILVFNILLISSSRGFAISSAQPIPKTLQRQYDIVTINGSLLSRLAGKDISHLRLYACSAGKLLPIPYQIDERDPAGEYVFTGGDLAGMDLDRGKLDANDELVFLCSQTGDQATQDLWPEGSTAGHEIIISDPRDAAQKGWAYLLYFPKDPPAPATEDYLSYDPVQDRIFCKYYTVGYKKGYTLYTDLIYPKEFGGSGKDIIDRLKIRLYVKLLSGLVRIKRTEDDIRCKVVGWKDGPIRVLRNTENYFRVLFNIPSPSLFAVTEYYPHYFTVPMRFSVPFNLKWVMNKFVVSGFAAYAYPDFHKSLVGAMGYTNRNLQGIHFTGQTSEETILEKYDLSNLGWGYFVKEGEGNWLCRIYFPDAFLQYFQFYMKDDLSSKNPPEDEPGEIAGGSFIYSASLQKAHGVPGGRGITPDLWDSIQSGTFELCMDTYIVPVTMPPDGVDEWLAIRDHPLWVDVSKDVTESDLIMGESDPRLTRAIIHDHKGRQIHLRDLFFHIGSSRTTAWDYVLGYQIEEGKWYTIPLKEVRQMDFRTEKIDPLTGLPNPLFISVIKKDKSIIDLFNAKSASFSGHIGEEETIFIWNTLIKRIELVDPK